MAKTLGDITGELTDKVLAPAKAEADSILKNARAEAARIVAAAEAEAEKIREATKRETNNLKKQMDVDMETAARNFIIMIEERLEKAVVDPVVEEAVKPLFSDRAFLEKIITELIIEHNRNRGKEHHIEILLPQAQREELENWFLAKFREKLSQPLDVRFTDKISFGFKIGHAGTGSHINFSDGLLQVFSEFCSPRFRKHFFPVKES